MINGGGDVLSTLPDGVGEMRAVLADASLDDNRHFAFGMIGPA